jgi:hypothetical protein
MVKQLSSIRAKLSKEQIRKLKSGGSINIKPEQVGSDGEELKLSHLKHKKLSKNHSKAKAFRLSLSGEEKLNGEGVEAVGNTPLHTIKIPPHKILTPKVTLGGKVQAGIDRTPTSSYNTFVGGGHPATSPLIGTMLDQSRPNPVVYGVANPKKGGCMGYVGAGGTPFNPLLPKNLDQSCRQR